MRHHRCTQPQPLTQILWLHITLSERFDAAAVQHWRKRLHDYLTAHGLVAAISPAHVAVLSLGRAITPADRGLVTGWLMTQAEVVLVRIERRVPTPRFPLARCESLTHGRGLSSIAPRPIHRKDDWANPSDRAGPS